MPYTGENVVTAALQAVKDMKFAVENPAGSATYSPGPCEGWSQEAIEKCYGKKPVLPKQVQESQKQAHTPLFYQHLGDIVDSSDKKGAKLRCVHFVAFIAHKLQKATFPGTIKVGLIGETVGTGHVFLILNQGDGANERYVDAWSALQKKDADAVCLPGSYRDLLPEAVQSTYDKSGPRALADL